MVLDGKCSQDYVANVGFPHDSILGLTLFLLFIYFLHDVIWPWMEYCCYIWAVTANDQLDILDKLLERLCRTISPYFVASPLLVFFLDITFTDFYLNRVNWFHLIILVAGPLVALICCMFLLSPFLDVVMLSLLTVSFLAQWDSRILCLQNASFYPWPNWLYV